MTSRKDYRRGDVVMVRLDPVEGSEQGGTRPVVIVSNDALNDALPVLTVAVLTSRKVERVFPTEVLVNPPEGGLRKPSKILLYQLRTISKDRVGGKMGKIGRETLSAVEEALCVAFDLPW